MLRMDVAQFDCLLEIVNSLIKKKTDTKMRMAISTMTKLKSLAYFFCVPTISMFLPVVLSVISESLKSFLKVWLDINLSYTSKDLFRTFSRISFVKKCLTI